MLNGICSSSARPFLACSLRRRGLLDLLEKNCRGRKRGKEGPQVCSCWVAKGRPLGEQLREEMRCKSKELVVKLKGQNCRDCKEILR